MSRTDYDHEAAMAEAEYRGGACRERLPCGIRDGAWAKHVCRLPADHADVDSPCRCAVCDSGRCADCGSTDPATRFVIERMDGKGPVECDNAFHGGQP